jgi:hypothetical protein
LIDKVIENKFAIKSGKHQAQLLLRPYNTHRVRQSSDRLRAPVCEDLDAAFGLLKPRHISVFSVIVSYFNRYTTVFPSQATIAALSGKHETTVNKALVDLEYLGLVSTENFFNNSCEYKIDDRLKDPVIRKKFSSLLGAFLVMPISLLLANCGMDSRSMTNLGAGLYTTSKSYSLQKSSENFKISVGGESFSDHISAGNYIRTLYDEDTWEKIVFAQANNLPIPFNFKSAASLDSIKQVTSDSKRRKSMKQLGQIVSEMGQNPIRQSIRELKFLSLSRWGQMELMQFPDKAIEYAARASKMAKPRDPFRFFIALCYEYCRNNDITPAAATTIAMVKEYKRPENFTMTLKPITSAQFAKGFSEKYTVPASGNGATAQRNSSPQRKQISNEEFYAKKQLAADRVNAELISRGKQPLPVSTHKDPFKMDDAERAEYFSKIDKNLLNPILKLGLSAPRVERAHKLLVIKTMIDLNIPFEGIISQQQLDQIMARDIMSPEQAVNEHLLSA